MFYSCKSLREVPAFNFSNVYSSWYPFSYCDRLTRILITGIGPNVGGTFDVEFCNLSSAALNELYTNLGSTTYGTIEVGGNYGTSFDDPSIATAKGWTVYG